MQAQSVRFMSSTRLPPAFHMSCQLVHYAHNEHDKFLDGLPLDVMEFMGAKDVLCVIAPLNIWRAQWLTTLKRSLAQA